MGKIAKFLKHTYGIEVSLRNDQIQLFKGYLFEKIYL